MIYAGANDGFLRGFLAGEWDAGATPPAYDHGTGKELFGFMPWPGRQKVKDLPNDLGGRDLYFVDGSPTVTDAWFYTDPIIADKADNGSEWHTVLVGGLRQGGETVYALDISNPRCWRLPQVPLGVPAGGRTGIAHGLRGADLVGADPHQDSRQGQWR